MLIKSQTLFCSLFDNGEARYAKLRKSIEQFSMSQIGLYG